MLDTSSNRNKQIQTAFSEISEVLDKRRRWTKAIEENALSLLAVVFSDDATDDCLLAGFGLAQYTGF